MTLTIPSGAVPSSPLARGIPPARAGGLVWKLS